MQHCLLLSLYNLQFNQGKLNLSNPNHIIELSYGHSTGLWVAKGETTLRKIDKIQSISYRPITPDNVFWIALPYRADALLPIAFWVHAGKEVGRNSGEHWNCFKFQVTAVILLGKILERLPKFSWWFPFTISWSLIWWFLPIWFENGFVLTSLMGYKTYFITLIKFL